MEQRREKTCIRGKERRSGVTTREDSSHQHETLNINSLPHEKERKYFPEKRNKKQNKTPSEKQRMIMKKVKPRNNWNTERLNGRENKSGCCYGQWSMPKKDTEIKEKDALNGREYSTTITALIRLAHQEASQQL